MVVGKFRKKKRKHPGYRRCGQMVYSDATKALLMAKNIKNLLNVEFKNHDVQATALALNTTGTITQLTNIAIGDTTNTRDGSSLKIVSLLFSYILRINSSATDSQFRIMLVQDRQTNEAIYTVGDLLSDTTINDVLVAPRNLDNGHRFSVLYDKLLTLSAAGRATSGHKFYKKMNLKIRYDNAAAAITSLTQSSLSLLVITNEPTNVPSITFNIRLRYVDN